MGENYHIQATSDSNNKEASCSILAQVCTKNNKWYSSNTVKWILHRPWVRIKLWSTVALSKSSHLCKACSLDSWLLVLISKAMSLGPQSMYSNMDLTWPRAIEDSTCKISAIVLNMPTDGVNSGNTGFLLAEFNAESTGESHWNSRSMEAKAQTHKLRRPLVIGFKIMSLKEV